MRYATLLPLVAVLATAIVIPNDEMAQKLTLETEKPIVKITKPVEETAMDWWQALRSTADQTIDTITQGTHKLLNELSENNPLGSLLDTNDPGSILNAVKPENFYVGNPGYNLSTNLTIYEAIQECKYTQKFAALVKDFPDLVNMLNSTDANVTAFIPVDRAFEKIPKDHKQPPKEFLEKIIQYHILPGNFSAGRLFHSHTVPTTLKDDALDGRPQRLRVSISFFRLRLNFYSRVLVGDMNTKNGVIHAVDSILVPPPPARRIISLFPTMFSTLELAAEKTGLLPHRDGDGDGGHLGEGFTLNDGSDGHNLTGLTVFAPTNFAFAKLGPAVNAFLFNTEKGLNCLRALLKYHIVANQTLYSDEFYDERKKPGDGAGSEDDRNGHFHVDLPTLLGNESLSIDIARYYRFVNIRVNGYTNVAIEDGVAQDGVVQVVNSVLVPPHSPKRGDAWIGAESEIPVEELVERLEPYLGDEKEEEKSGEDGVWGEL
ncbi:FAS1 domain-containing protein [Xylaria sp. CBS 124048]|nr:FAS1 domain-containing protein [Xylaria sp. CBS 124048]